MNILIVGGTGMIGINSALHLQARGHDVALAARNTPEVDHPAAQFPILTRDFTRGEFTKADLAPFDAVVFAAGNDPRHMPAGEDPEDFYRRTQSDSVPVFAALARDAGVRRFVQVGSYYHQVRPDLARVSTYIRARQLADEGARALATESFAACTLNPPSIVGATPGLPARRYQTLAEWGRGQRAELPATAPPGGTNYMSVRSLAQAIEGALLRGQPGKAYLVGDESLSYRDFFQMFFDVAGTDTQVEVVDKEHKVLPDAFIVQGRGNAIAYEPDPEAVALLGFARGDVRRAVAEVVAMATGRKEAAQ
ncbi:NAD-dependent epimerase/dehydratase family protein [Marinovum sp.]|uniref:NAD-dependent epimerase/dehydratase family protein n=1 Tax=Marinovum sp. TaxID=2024839 RepID=UPI002B26F1A8|nr:NAD-dependent epimerase/dehydratase family protein [Marinovum sp.]